MGRFEPNFQFVFLASLVLLGATESSAIGADDEIASPAQPQFPLHKRIDEFIAARSDGPVAARTTDSEFVRRVYLDFAGRIPTVDEARSFFADAKPDKREQLIDRLLDSDEFPRRMRDVFDVMLMERMGDNPEWLRFLESSFANNQPWDQTVRKILRPDAENESTRGSAWFWTKRLEKYGQNPTDYPGLARDVGRLFLGVDVQCAQCHDHLFIDDYKQSDFQGLFAFVNHTFIRTDVKFPAVGEKLVTQKLQFASVFTQEQKSTGPRLPAGQEVSIPRLNKDEQYAVPPDKKTRAPGVPKFSPLAVLADQLPARDNTAFRRNTANRLWFVMFGRGLVEPLDQHHSANPPSHPKLLEVLADELAAHNFELKWFLKQLAMSETWQRSTRLPDGVKRVDAASYRVAIERSLSAEQLLLSTLQVVGKTNLVTAAAADDESKDRTEFGELLVRFRTTFANTPRDPEVDFRPSVKAALFLLNDEEIQKWFAADFEARIKRLSGLSDNQLLADELYMTVFSRNSTEHEAAQVVDLMSQQSTDRSTMIGHLMWALTSSAEFCLNH